MTNKERNKDVLINRIGKIMLEHQPHGNDYETCDMIDLELLKYYSMHDYYKLEKDDKK